MSRQDEIERLKQAIAAQEALRGILPDEQIEATLQALRAQLARYQAELHDGGAVAQGPGAKAVGARGVFIGGDAQGNTIQTGDTHIHLGEPSEDPDALERAYLSALMTQAGQLSLEGIDPQAASEAEKRLSLGAVYTALLTLAPEAHEKLERGEIAMRRTSRRSALEELNAHPHLVLLGDPGSGKTTFVNFLSLCLAGERLGHQTLNIEALTAPLPDNDGDDQKERQPWDHGPLLPVRVILRDLAARGLPAPGQPVTVEHLWAFLADELAAWGLSDYAPHLRRTLQKQGGIFLFDGLDEVPEAEARREQIIQLVRQVKAAFPECRVLVTSRTYAYRHQDWALDGFKATVLAPFSRGQIIRFVDRWYAHIATLREMDAADAQGRAQLLKRAIFASERLRALAERPLLLTLMASLHAWRGGSLPEKREQLYNDAVDLLLDWWERRRVVREKDGTVRLIQPSLAEYLNVGKDRLRKLLNRLAYEAHAAQPELRGTADIPEERLVQGLLDLTDEGDIRPKRLVEYLRDRAGLLIPRGVGVYTFPHRTFQEYLAACHLTDTGYPDEVAQLARQDPHRWREVCLLAGAKATRGGAFALWPLVDALCPDAPGKHPTEPDLWGALLAGQAIAENAGDGPLSEANQRKQARVRDWQVVILHSALPAVERARAGDTLALLGDPRFDPQRGFLPARRWDPQQGRWVPEATWGFIRIPAGPFLMGAGREKHEMDLNYDYWIARYPVTVAQWRAFVEARGYHSFDKDALRDPDNRPVRWVTWYNALDYTRWLDEVLRAAAPEMLRQQRTPAAQAFWEGLAAGHLRVTLPSEAEWEKAARGTDGRLYPWGDAFDPQKANTEETGIGTTTAVGAFPGGASPRGVLDLSGNVWEWTRNLRKGYPYNPMDGREDLNAPRNPLRVLRGGSFGLACRYARAAFRFENYPSRGGRFSGFRVVVIPGSVVSEG